jgi:hypothetical protein
VPQFLMSGGQGQENSGAGLIPTAMLSSMFGRMMPDALEKLKDEAPKATRRSAIPHPAARAAGGILVERLFRLAGGRSRIHAGVEGAAGCGACRCRALFAQAGLGGGSKSGEQDSTNKTCLHVSSLSGCRAEGPVKPQSRRRLSEHRIAVIGP